MQHIIGITSACGVSVTALTVSERTHGARRGRHSARLTLERTSALATAAVIALVIASVSVAALAMLADPQPPAPTGWTSVSVEPNASLWTLASAHPVEGLSTQETVQLIEQENGLTTGMLQVGDTLLVPATSSSATALAQR